MPGIFFHDIPRSVGAAFCRRLSQNDVLSRVRKNCWSLATEWDWKEHIGVTSTFCIRTMHPAREFSTTPKTLQHSQCTLLRRLRRQTATSFLFGEPRNHPKEHYFETINNIQNAVTESPEEENSRRYSCKSGRTSGGIYFRGDNRNCYEFGNSRTSKTIREGPKKSEK